MSKLKQSDVLERERLQLGKFFIMSANREEHVDTPEKLRDLLATLWALADEDGFRLSSRLIRVRPSDWRH